MSKSLFLAALMVLTATPVLAAEDPDTGLDEESYQAPANLPSAEQLKNLKVSGQNAGLAGTGIKDMASAMRLVKIGQAIKAKKKVSPEDLQFLRTYLKQMGLGDPSNAASLQKLDQVLEKLQRSTSEPTEEDEMMRDFADGADMDDLPSLDQ